jgi:hypothetical protein
LYRASEHGFLPSDFHENCDLKPKTLTIIKSSNGNIFGGYTDESWQSNLVGLNAYKSDRNAFLFSLINLHKQPKKIKISQTFDRAICSNPKCGPAFGNGATELILSYYNGDYQNSLLKGQSHLKDCYQLANYPQGANGSNFLAGSIHFEVVDVEVFMKN